MSFAAGTEFSGYQIIEPIGRGGQSMVYLAMDIKLRRKVAVKFLSDASLDDEHGRRRFLLEAQTLSSLNHPNIATIFHIGEYQDLPFIVMEYVSGLTLHDYLAQHHPEDDVLMGLIIGIVEAISAAHCRGIIHRDLKPGNIMVSAQGQPKLLDFGLARITREDERRRLDSPTELTATGIVMGTVYYLSPEQALSNSASEQSDLFSLGVILYEMFAGKRPFDRNSAITTLYAIIHADPPPMPVHSPLSAALKPVVFRLLEKEPGRRYPSAESLLADLRNIQKGMSSGSGVAVSRTIRLKRSFEFPYRMMLWPILIILLLTGSFFLWQNMRPAGTVEHPAEQMTPGVLVLPIKSGSTDEDRHLADIMTSEIVSSLSRVPNLQVLSVPSIMPVDEAAWREKIIDRNRVGFTLTGGLTREADRFRLTVQIVSQLDYRVVWSRTFNEEINRIFTIPAVVAARLAFEAGVVFKAEQLDFPGTEAFGLYTRAVMLLNSYDPESMPRSVSLLRDCIQVAPRFRPAYEMLSLALMQYRNTGIDYNPSFLEEAYRVIRRGREMAGDSPRLRVQEIWFHIYSYNFKKAIDLSQALNRDGLAPQEALKQRVWLAFFQGKSELATALLEEAVRKEPYDPSAYLNRVVLGVMLGKSDVTIEQFYLEAGEIFKSPLVAAVIDGWRLMSKTDYQGAFQAFTAAGNRENHRLMNLAAGEALFAAGDFQGAIPQLEAWLKQNPFAMEGWWLLCLCHESLGQKGEHQIAVSQALGYAETLYQRFPSDFLKKAQDYFSVLLGKPIESEPLDISGQASMTLYLDDIIRLRLGQRTDPKNLAVPFNPTYWMNRFHRQELKVLTAGLPSKKNSNQSSPRS